MMIKRETALEAAGDFRVNALPGAPLGERRNLWQVVAASQFIQQEVRERSGRLSDDEPGMPAALQQDDGAPQPPCDHGKK